MLVYPVRVCMRVCNGLVLFFRCHVFLQNTKPPDAGRSTGASGVEGETAKDKAANACP